MANYYLTDKRDNLTKWEFPDSFSQILPNEYMIIWCDEDQDDGALHTNFKLSSGGEFLALVHPDGETIIDSIFFPSQEEDVSYGRIFSTNNEVEWDYLAPTPGYSNTSLQIFNNKLLINSFDLNSVYPNPFNSNFVISLDVHNNFEKFKVDLVSLMGRTILSKTVIPASSGTLTIPMNMDQIYASGTYLVRIKGNNTSITKKIIMLK